MSSDCDRVRELLPWYLNGTLEPEEVRAVVDHLEACSGCREELEETARVVWIAGRHPPTEALTDYAFGDRVEAIDRATLERHLEHCPSCRDELASARRAAATSGEERYEKDRRSLGRSPLALAASLLLGVMIGFFWQGPGGLGPGDPEGRPAVVQVPGAEIPRTDVSLVELLPEMTLRGEQDLSAVEIDRDRGPLVMLLVALNDPGAADEWTARLVAEGGETVFVVDSAVPDPSGALTILVPIGILPSGPSTLVVSAADEGVEATRYRVVISGDPASQPERTKDAQ